MIIISAFIEKEKLLSGAQAREKLYQNYSLPILKDMNRLQ